MYMHMYMLEISIHALTRARSNLQDSGQLPCIIPKVSSQVSCIYLRSSLSCRQASFRVAEACQLASLKLA